jgi:hypothetical protein
MPPDRPVTLPVAEPIEMVAPVLLHKPPETVSVKVVIEPMHRLSDPTIIPISGNGLTVIIAVVVIVHGAVTV